MSDQTIRNRLHARNLRARCPVVRQPLTRQHRIARRQWALVHRRWTRAEWRMVMFSDESRYNLDHHVGRIRVWRRPSERYLLHLVLPHMKGGVVAQLWFGPVFGVPGELIWLL